MPRSRSKAAWIVLVILPLVLFGCAIRGTTTHKVTVAQHSLKSVVQAFEDAEIAEHEQGWVPDDLHRKMQDVIHKVALAAIDLDKATVAGATAKELKGRLDAIYTLLDSLNSDGILGIKHASTKAILEVALDAIKGIIDNALVQVS